MAFVGILFLLMIFAMLIFGVFAAVTSLILGLSYRKQRKHWMKIAAVVSGAAAALGLLVSGGFLIWATSF